MKRLTIENITNLKELYEKYSLNSMVKITGFSKSTIYYHVKNNVIKKSKFDITRINDWEKGYLVGIFMSDGCLFFDKTKGLHMIKFYLNNKCEQRIAERIRNTLIKGGLKSRYNVYENKLIVTCYSKVLYNYLNNFVFYKKIDGYRKKFDMIDITNYKKSFKFGFVAGYIDGDGYIGKYNIKYLRVLIFTSRKNLAKKVKKILDSINIYSHLQCNKRKEYTIRLSTPFYQKEAVNINCVKQINNVI